MGYQQTRKESWIFSSLDILGETSRLHTAQCTQNDCSLQQGAWSWCVVTQQHTMLEKGARREKPKEASAAFELNITCNVARLLLYHYT